MWLGYLDEYSDYMTQGETIDELKENIIDIYKELRSGYIPAVRPSMKRRDLISRLEKMGCIFIPHGGKNILLKI